MTTSDLLRKAEQLKQAVEAAASRGEYDYAMQHDVLRLGNELSELRSRLERVESALGLS